MARLADIYGDSSLKADALSKLSVVITASSFSNYYETAYSDMRSNLGGGHFWGIPVFNSTLQSGAAVAFCAPEIGKIINENHKNELTDFVYQFVGDAPDEHVYKTMPGWFAFRADYQPYWAWSIRSGLFGDHVNVPDNTHGGENSYLNPDIHFTIFMFRKYVYEDPPENLEKYIDYPTCIGDLYHIQKLVAAIEAFGDSNWEELWNTPVRIIKPNGGENLQQNESYQIEWISTSSIANIDISFSADDFASDVNIITTDFVNSGNFNWNVPEIYSTALKIKVSNSDNSNVFDISDSNFSIIPEPFFPAFNILYLIFNRRKQ